MVHVEGSQLVFSFPEVHPAATLRVTLHRTLRIPDDGRSYPLPPGLGPFPLEHVDDHASRVPSSWRLHGGVMLPMYQAEAMWLGFSGDYPMAVKVAAGKVNALTGDPWDPVLRPVGQDYLVTPDQRWLDGFVVEKGLIRQFVAMPLGAGYTVEEQLTGAAEHGGVQILVYPLRGEAWERTRRPRARERVWYEDLAPACASLQADSAVAAEMGIGAGGTMRQEVYEDRRSFEDWDVRGGARCFVHLVNAMLWRAVTGSEPPPTPLTAAEYARHGLPWFEVYAEEGRALGARPALAGVPSVAAVGAAKGDVPLPENESVDPRPVLKLWHPGAPGRVREGEF